MKLIKEIFLTVAYLIVLFVILWFNNFAFMWATLKFVVPIFNWFYELDWFWKAIILLFGGFSVVMIFYTFLNMLGIIFNEFLSKLFPHNIVTLIGSITLCLASLIKLEIFAWQLPKGDLWLFGLWLVIALVIVQINWIFIYKRTSND